MVPQAPAAGCLPLPAEARGGRALLGSTAEVGGVDTGPTSPPALRGRTRVRNPGRQDGRRPCCSAGVMVAPTKYWEAQEGGPAVATDAAGRRRMTLPGASRHAQRRFRARRVAAMNPGRLR